MRAYHELIKDFYIYVNKFYNIETGIEPIATDNEIQQAVNTYLEIKPLSQIEFDSLDREFVRQILQPSYRII